MNRLTIELDTLKKHIPNSEQDLELFLSIFYETALFVNFDWMNELPPNKLNTYDVRAINDRTLLSKILTVHVRLDRFVNGHLLEFCRSGKMLTLLDQLSECEKQSPNS